MFLKKNLATNEKLKEITSFKDKDETGKDLVITKLKEVFADDKDEIENQIKNLTIIVKDKDNNLVNENTILKNHKYIIQIIANEDNKFFKGKTIIDVTLNKTDATLLAGFKEVLKKEGIKYRFSKIFISTGYICGAYYHKFLNPDDNYWRVDWYLDITTGKIRDYGTYYDQIEHKHVLQDIAQDPEYEKVKELFKDKPTHLSNLHYNHKKGYSQIFYNLNDEIIIRYKVPTYELNSIWIYYDYKYSTNVNYPFEFIITLLKNK